MAALPLACNMHALRTRAAWRCSNHYALAQCTLVDGGVVQHWRSATPQRANRALWCSSYADALLTLMCTVWQSEMWSWLGLPGILLAVLGVVPAVSHARRARLERYWAMEAMGAARAEEQLKGQRWSDDARSAAAVRWLDKLHPENKISHKARFIRQWYTAMAAGGDVTDAHRSGRNERMSDIECDFVIRRIRMMDKDEQGKKRPYTSIGHACQKDPVIAEIRDEHGYSDEGFLKRLQKRCPALVHRKVTVKPMLTDKQRAARVAACKFYLKQPFYYFKRIFWIDCKTLYCRPKAGYALIHEDDIEFLTAKDKRMNCKIADSPVLKFYAMVNWFGGVVAVWFCQGTTGVPLRYKVSCLHGWGFAFY